MEPDTLFKLAGVFALAALELWAAVPAGLALGLHPALVAVTAATGAWAGAAVIGLLGARARAWVLARRGGGGPHAHGVVRRVWERYGVVGLGLLAPLLVGAPLGTAVGVAAGAPLRSLLAWMAAGVTLWSGLLAAAGALGLAGLEVVGS